MIRIPDTTARGLMVSDVLELQVGAPVHEAVEAFEDYHIHGAPVVDEACRLVGVLTEADIVRSERIHEQNFATVPSLAERQSCDVSTDEVKEHYSPREDYPAELLGRETVGDWMTSKVISVSPDATLQRICSILATEQIHRVFVVDDEKLVGVVSAIDVVRHIADST